ncbi:WG repeat-containing protein [Cohnella cholangitidis]|uniref:WG repeat-containing protein n=2 Tax=Cohnella cholangitidis TaxID=2598458 RepID=A0A7G5BU94_9BACL|nr:WG repeat-containing protein [Cohnella cholangitidis]
MLMFGFIDINGNEIIAPEYNQTYSFLEGYACVQKGDKYYYINLKGELIDPGPYTHCRPFCSGLAPVFNQSSKLGWHIRLNHDY